MSKQMNAKSSDFLETSKSEKEQENARKELTKLMRENGFIAPNRGNLDDPKIKWRNRKPDYTFADLAFMEGKTQNHAPGSLELIVENLVKTWEMESSHKPYVEDWTTVDPEIYTIQANGGRKFNLKESMTQGNYNVLMDGVNPELYDAKHHTFHSSHELMQKTFTEGFPWEVIKVFSPPPKVAFSWRHWGTFNGEYKGRKGTGEVMEMFGFLIAEVNEELKICSLEVFYDPESFLLALSGQIHPDELRKGNN